LLLLLLLGASLHQRSRGFGSGHVTRIRRRIVRVVFQGVVTLFKKKKKYINNYRLVSYYRRG
jgi:hypothetical protein